MNIKDAAYDWVKGMNAIPQGMISKLMSDDIDDWCEVTTPSIGDRVFAYEEQESGEVINVIDSEYEIKLDNDSVVKLVKDDFEVDYDDLLPMWGTMWSFGDSIDDWWLDEEDGIKKMSECGFRIYHSDEFGYFFGIDGAGYDFYDSHWIPLYKARGLQWHLYK